MELTPQEVERQRDWVRDRPTVVDLVNETRQGLEGAFSVDVDPITGEQYRNEVDEVFADGDRGVNVAALVGLLRDLDVEGDYPGFVVDELLGRQLAATIAGGQPRATLAEATFHYADIEVHGDTDDPAGADDLDAALAAGFQTRLPGWPWTARESPFALPPE